jgi:hypothetical protein
LTRWKNVLLEHDIICAAVVAFRAMRFQGGMGFSFLLTA